MQKMLRLFSSVIDSKMCIVALGRESKIKIKLRKKYHILIVHDS